MKGGVLRGDTMLALHLSLCPFPDRWTFLCADILGCKESRHCNCKVQSPWWQTLEGNNTYTLSTAQTSRPESNSWPTWCGGRISGATRLCLPAFAVWQPSSRSLRALRVQTSSTPSPQPPSKKKNCWLGTPSFSATTTTPIFEIEMGKTYQIQIKLILLWTSATRLSASSCILLFSHFLRCFRNSQLFSTVVIILNFHWNHKIEISSLQQENPGISGKLDVQNL